MNSKKIVRAEAAVNSSIEKVEQAQRQYRRPQVHDLGSLEQVQGLASGYKLDLQARWHW
jgi:hypothetical protein